MTNARRKGRRGEKYVAQMLTEGLNEAGLEVLVRRKLGAARDGGDDLEMVDGRGRIHPTVMGFSIEVKYRKKLNFNAAWRQCVSNAKNNHPALIYKVGSDPWMVLIDSGSFLTEMTVGEFILMLREKAYAEYHSQLG